ncbi:flagellar biosynthesis regulator FlaF [uncultured Hyphomonas sp.]|uniref:flagellar biosynthesis regulator FlaF n=1 Tax=uncultured Hyphomonas sp. TaxID=225298 RepID=UPI002AABE248|nr:flagellar biosynthesis regulator FlaF [uncultured Hyphomonas sp.]
MQSLAFKAYGEVKQRTAGEKEIEFALFRQITDALTQVSEAEDAQPADWADAIHRNQQLWTTIAVDLLHPGNALPDDMKRSLLYLAEFVRQTSMKIMAGEGEIADLIEINRSIMNGLGGTVAGDAAGEGL